MNEKRIYLNGGIGNQLFLYSFGKFLDKALNTKAIYSYALQPVGLTRHNSFISDFVFFEEKIFAETKVEQAFEILLFYASAKAQRLGITFGTNQIYHNKKLGYLESLKEFERATRIYGYFQSWIYANEVWHSLDIDKLFYPKNPSKYFESRYQQSIFLLPTMIHLRRGDFQQGRFTFGLLDKTYYRNVLNSKMSQSNNPIWIFSDDVKEAHDLKDTLSETFDCEVVEGLSAVETLSLFANASNVITANSTFSWWGGFISSLRGGRVIVPSPWHRNYEIPDELFPKTWETSSAIWL